MLHFRVWGRAATVAALLSVGTSGGFAPSSQSTPTIEAAAVAAAAAVDPSLSVWDGERWRPWWTSATAPARWRGADMRVAGAVQWSSARPGIDIGVVRFSGAGEAWRFAVVLLRIDSSRHALSLHVKRSADGRALPWSADELPEGASFGINAGMFDALGPWGWLVLDGVERQPPGTGALAGALVVAVDGGPRIVPADSIGHVRAAGVRWAVQSYPVALVGDGEIPLPLRSPGAGVDLEHRDARAAVATTRDGRVLIALTRFDALSGILGGIPLGPTLPEMTAILGALGAQRALFLDGGISGQMAVRDDRGRIRRWDGLRRVPLGLVGTPRER